MFYLKLHTNSKAVQMPVTASNGLQISILCCFHGCSYIATGFLFLLKTADLFLCTIIYKLVGPVQNAHLHLVYIGSIYNYHENNHKWWIFTIQLQ